MNEKIALISLGCPKNQVDAEAMLAKLQTAGYDIVGDVEGADLVIINTCGFIEDAKREAIETILSVAELKKEGSVGAILVTGCLAQRYKEEVINEIPEIDGIIGIGSNGEIAEVCARVLSKKRVCDFTDKLSLPIDGDRILSTPSHFAYLKIAEGCSNCCAYCAIPAIRGRFRSRTMESVLTEAKNLADAGVKELVLIAQDVTRYGVDIYSEFMLAKLLKELCRIDGIEWIRLLYCYPECMTDELIDTIAGEEKICKYIDLPLQHADACVLSRMNRRGSKDELLALVRKLRERIDGVIIRTTMLVGFPGETEENFETLCDFVKEARFDRLGCFAFSPEEGTPAAKMDGQLDPEIKNHRAELIMEEQYPIFEEKQKAKIGKTFKVIVDGFDEENLFYVGRTYMDCIEIDSIVIISTEEELFPGEFVNVKIIATEDCDLVGEVVR